jgi:DNA-binding NtrC family response regulator
MTADDMIRESEMHRSEAFNLQGKPLYSLARIRRRALCEAVCEGVPDGELIGMRDEMRKLARAAALRRTEAKAEVAAIQQEAIRPLKELEREAIVNAVAVAGNGFKAAEALGISANTVYRKLGEYRSSDLAVDVNPRAHRDAVDVTTLYN